MSDNFSRDVIQISVAKILKHIGWDSCHQTSLEVLTDLLQHYIMDLAVKIHKYSELCGRTVPDLNDVAMVFNDLSINIEDMENYICSVKPPQLSVNIPQYPIKKESHLNPLRPGNREVITRPLHIHDHLPPMYPELEKEEDKIKNPSDESCSSNLLSSSTSSSSSLLKSTSRFKQCCDPTLLDYTHKKKSKLEVGQPLREIKTVIMTASGYLSSGVEGKFPESRIPSTCTITSSFNSLETSLSTKSVRSETKIRKESSVNKRKRCMKNYSSKCKRLLSEGKSTTSNLLELEKTKFDDSNVKKLVNMKELAKLCVFKKSTNTSE